jgi:hypothetical protein
MKNFLLTTIMMITSFVALSQTLETKTPNRFFLQETPYIKQRPDGFGPRRDLIPRGPQLPIPDSIYLRNGRIVFEFDEQKIKQFILQERKKWRNM